MSLPSWISRKYRSGQRSRRPARSWSRLTVEQLETRLAPVIGANALATAVVRGDDFDGVVSLGGCTGSLLFTGRHILTAAHCVDANGPIPNPTADGPSNVRFDMIRGATPINININVPTAFIAVHPGWQFNNLGNANDLAILRLTDQVNAAIDRHLIAPFGAQRYEVFRGNNEVGQNFTIVGYGETGIGNTGQQSDEVQRVSITNPVAGTFTLTFNGQTTAAIAQNANAQTVAAALRGLANIGQDMNGVANVVVSTAGLPANTWDIRFVNQLGFTNVNQLTGTASGGATVNVNTQFDGNQAGINGVKRSGQNRYDDTIAGGNILRFDFDNGNGANDALGGNTGLGANEGFGSRGDSGGPGFLRNAMLNRWEIATVVSFTQAPGGNPPDINNYVDGNGNRRRDNSFGEINGDTRVSVYAAPFIDTTVAGNYHLVLDMQQQVLGNDGLLENLTIIARRNGANIEIEVVNNSSAGTFAGIYYSAPATEILSLTLRGSGDNETFRIEGDLGINVTVDGRGGTDTIHGIGNFDYSLTSSLMTVGNPLRTVTLAGIENGRLDGGASQNTFTVHTANLTTVTVHGGDGIGDGDLLDLTMTGGTFVVDTDTLFLNSAVTTNASGAQATINAINGGRIDLNGAARIFNVANGAAASDLVVNTPLDGPGDGLFKAGTGVLALAGAGHTYNGTTTVDAGTLQVHANISASPVVVNANGTLAGNGSVGSVTSTGNVSPGVSAGSVAGVLTTGSVALTAGSSYTVQLGGTGVGQHDRLDVTGTVNLGGTTLVRSLVGGYTPVGGAVHVIIRNDGADAVVGTFAGLPQGALLSIGGVPFHIFYNWNADGPGLGNDVALVRNAPPVINSPGPQSVQYSDPLTFAFTVTDADSILPTSAISITGLPVGATYVINCVSDGLFGSICTVSVSGIVTAGPGVYNVSVMATDEAGDSDSEIIPVEVKPEDARATYTGPMCVSTANINTSVVDVPLRVTVRDITVVDPSASPPFPDIYPGDIREARVRFDVYNEDGTLLLASLPNIPVNLINGSLQVGTAYTTWQTDLGNNNCVIYKVVATVTRYYTNNTQTDLQNEALVTVCKPLPNFITGGGYLVPTASGGTYAADAGSKMNFGFNVKFNQSGRNLQGRVNILVRRTVANVLRTYQIKSNMLESLVVDPTTGKAEFYGKATLKDVTNPLNPIDLGGNLTLHMKMHNNGEPGDADTLAITLWRNSTLWFSSHWNGAATLERVLAGGNLNVHSNNSFLRGTQTGSGTETLSEAELTPLVQAAVQRWTQVGGDPALLAGVRVLVTDLPGNALGMAAAGTVWIDGDAAGQGWFVDTTPWDDSEFMQEGDQGEAGRMDLLTVIAHELGHVLGLEHSDDGLMAEALLPGVRLLPGEGDRTEHDHPFSAALQAGAVDAALGRFLLPSSAWFAPVEESGLAGDLSARPVLMDGGLVPRDGVEVAPPVWQNRGEEMDSSTTQEVCLEEEDGLLES